MTLSRLNEAQNCLAQHHTPWRTQWIYILFYRFLYPYTLYYCCSQNFLPKASKHSIYHIIYIIRNLQKVHSAYLKVEDSSHLGGCLHLKTPLSFLLSTKKLLNLMAYFVFLMLPDFFASEHLIPQFPCFSNALLSTCLNSACPFKHIKMLTLFSLHCQLDWRLHPLNCNSTKLL